jgi:ABC-type uncharacterized transport system substrate-binding protein
VRRDTPWSSGNSQRTRVDLIINLMVAKALGLTLPQPVLLTAHEIIQPTAALDFAGSRA